MIAVILDYGPQLLRGAELTIVLTVASMLIAMTVGLGLAVLSSSRFLAMRVLSRAYVDFFRGTPLLLQLFFIYFVFPEVGVFLSPVVAGVSALSLNYAAYLSEVYRATIDAVDEGQWEAAMTLGMSRALAFRRIVLPQAFKIAVPPFGNYFIAMFKDTALVSTITVQELMFKTDSLASTTYQYLPLYTTAFVMYFVISYPASLLVRWFERRLSRRVSAPGGPASVDDRLPRAMDTKTPAGA
jgi:ectoine/hydroxyectoine ABC transporter permease protein EhuD